VNDEDQVLRGPAAKGVTRREEILVAVTAAVAERGFAGSTLREIAARVGTGEANILHHFGSKQQLFLEAIRRHDEEDIRDLNSADPSIADIISRHAATPGLIELLINMTVAASDSAHPLHEFFRERYDRIRDVGTGIWSAAAESGATDAALPADWAARVLLAAADGLQLQWLLDPTIDMAADIERLVQALLGAERFPTAGAQQEGTR